MSTRRESGLLVPLFSLTSSASWGVGEFLDLPVFADWAAAAGQSFVQILPITEIPEAETSPYSSLTASALDPIYISLGAVDDFRSLGGEGKLPAEDRSALERLRAAPRVAHRDVRALKARWLRRAFDQFTASAGDDRAGEFAAFTRDEAPWLDDYALFVALRRRHDLLPWWQWPEPLARRDQAALADARRVLASEIAYRKYVQWIAAAQWAQARQFSRPIRIFGDLPFMISADSPDVWSRQGEFRYDATVGVPPDAFSETGQDWGLPPWRWDVMASTDFAWMRHRARRTASLFDGFRLDHLVGLYRTYIRPLDKATKAFFAPADEPTQLALGEELVGIYVESAAEIIAEDLGTVPDFVRTSLQSLGVPGFKVVRWERQWTAKGQPFIDPAEYPELSVATTGTHDIETLATWCDGLDDDERALIEGTPSVSAYLGAGATLSDAVIRSLLDSPSRLVIIPVQDIFGWRDRINTPALVDEDNWTWRLPWRIDRLSTIEDAVARAERLASWTAAARRGVTP